MENNEWETLRCCSHQVMQPDSYFRIADSSLLTIALLTQTYIYRRHNKSGVALVPFCLIKFITFSLMLDKPCYGSWIVGLWESAELVATDSSQRSFAPVDRRAGSEKPQWTVVEGVESSTSAMCWIDTFWMTITSTQRKQICLLKEL